MRKDVQLWASYLPSLRITALDRCQKVRINRSKVQKKGKHTLNRAITKLFGREAGRKKQPSSKMGDIEYFTVRLLHHTLLISLASVDVPNHIAEWCLNYKLEGVE